jgi:hypothetical protein
MSFKQGPECCGGSVLQVRGDDNEPIHLALSAQQFFITFCYNKAKWAKYGRFKVLTSARTNDSKRPFGRQEEFTSMYPKA